MSYNEKGTCSNITGTTGNTREGVRENLNNAKKLCFPELII